MRAYGDEVYDISIRIFLGMPSSNLELDFGSGEWIRGQSPPLLKE